MAGELIADVAVEPEIVEEVVALEDAVLLDHPVVALADERLEDCRADVGMVERPERVADVVDERARDVLVVAISAIGACCCLQGVREPIDDETAVVTVEQSEVVHHPIGEPG